jgi:tetratricopeptide (TPR) repeat protein
LNKTIESYKTALESKPDDVEICRNLGIIYLDKNQTDEALLYFEKAIRLQPHTAEHYINYAHALKKMSNIDEAIEFFKIALDLDQDNYKIYDELGDLFIKIENYIEAIQCFKVSLEIKSDDPDLSEKIYKAYIYLGDALTEVEKYDAAVQCCEEALEFRPDDPRLLLNLAVALEKNGKKDNLFDLYDKILKVNNKNNKNHLLIKLEALTNLSTIYFETGNFDKLIECSKKMLDTAPTLAGAYLNMGNAYKEKMHIETAVDCYKKALKLNPDYPDAHFNLAVMDLFKGNFEKGFKGYEWRIERDIQRNLNSCPEIKTDKPMWDGSSLENKTILVSYEQGLGDTLQFARYLPLLAEMGAKVLFLAQPAMEKLLKQSDLKAEIIVSEDLSDLPPFDTYAFIMSLPYLFKTTLDNIPLSKSYLKADTEKTAQYREKYFRNTNLKVGIKWLGNPNGMKSRIIPFECFFPLFNINNVKFYSLQKGAGIEELKKVPERLEITNLGEAFEDFADTAAAIENLDLVICNDSSVVHLAAALGKPTWVLLPYAPEWRWLLNQNTSPWYDSVRLFRMDKSRDWNKLFEQVKIELTRLCRE